jgi:lipoprotein-anchoring transpeptidase ErfK/SrfK
VERAVSRISPSALFLVALGACRTAEMRSTPIPDPMPDAEPDPVDAGPVEDARAVKLTALRGALEAGTYEGAYIGAAALHTTVLDRTEWPPEPDAGPSPEAGVRLGYIRYGAKVAALTEPMSNAACLEGWYELVEGGYVCGKYATFDLRDPRVRLAPQPPNLAAPMPYKYGYATGHGTPVYRRVLSIEDRKKYEPWLAAPPPAPAAPENDESDDDTGGLLDPPAPPKVVDAGAVPWFMREHDGGRPPVSLDDLHGRGVLVRRMMRGFYLALDRDFKAAHARWWRTTAGFAVPFERVGLQGPASDFHGSWIKYDVTDIDGGAPLEPNGAAMLVTSGAAVKYTIDVDEKKLTWSAQLPKFTAVALSGEPLAIGGAEYRQTTYGYWVRVGDGMLVPPQEHADAGATEKWIDVDTTRQLLVAYEGARPRFMTRISSGKKNPVDPEKNWTTPPGVYSIREKHVTATMDGDVAADGPYSIEDVPWVMYFQGSYALHAAFWHSAFGSPRSHGCVNMAPIDARELFFWTEPRLPRGWHGVYATDASPGTRVVVHESGDKKK